ncbi:hypothetical protein OEZ86_011101 [Tetradesmus obliquus]|nr:hypothetical protein OEZ86_011101 [Tetradesmus obliquus]
MCLCSSCSEGKGPPGPEFMPSEFERHGGMAACKKWRFSIKVADGGPGMTLGRWLDMRGIQISSYPAKSRAATQRAKRPLDISKALMTAAGVAGPTGASSGMPAEQLDWDQDAAANMTSNSSALPHAAAGPQSACMWPQTAVTTDPGPDDVPLGYAIAAQLASGMAVGPGLQQQLQQLQQQHSTLASALGSAVAGQGQGQGFLGKTPSTGSASNVLRLPGPGPAHAASSGRASLDQLPPLHSGPSMQNSSSTAIMQMLQRHQQAAGQLHNNHNSQLTHEQHRLLGGLQPAIMGAADQPPGSAAAGSMQGLGSPGSVTDAAAAAAAAAQGRGGNMMLAGPHFEVDNELGSGAAHELQLQGGRLGGARGEFVVGPGSSAQLGSLKSEPESAAGFHIPASIRDAAQTGQRPAPPHAFDAAAAAAAVAGAGAMGAVESLRSWVTQQAAGAAGGAAAAAAPRAAARGSTPSADFKKLVGSVESRLDGLLEDRRRRKQLEEQVAAQGALLAQLQADFAEERRRRLAAEQQLAALNLGQAAWGLAAAPRP